MNAPYSDGMTMRAARERYFDVNGFGADGGYNDAWVDFKLGPLPLPFPNTAGRIEAVKFHDLHHVLTGYPTSATGEFEISAWEIGAGCTNMPAAWAINMSGLATGVISSPRRVYAAFMHGRRSRTLYHEPFDLILDRTVGDVRARFVGATDGAASTADIASFAASALIGAVVGLLFASLMLPLVPIGLVATWLRRRRQATRRVSA